MKTQVMLDLENGDRATIRKALAIVNSSQND